MQEQRFHYMGSAINNRPGLICVGLEKCGTTTLDLMLRGDRALSPPVGVKETRYFGGQYHRGREFYESLYAIAPETRYFVDVSPAYIRSADAIERISTDCDSETRILVCLRNPVYRAFSHYVHDLFHHHSAFDPARYGSGTNRFDQPYSLSFFDESEQDHQYHFTRYAPLLDRLFARFDPDRVMVLVLEEDFQDSEKLADRLSAFLELDSVNLAPGSRENPMRFPRYVYHPTKATEVTLPKGAVKVPAGRLALLKGDEVITLPVEDEKLIGEIVSAASRWTNRLSSTDAEQLFSRHFSEDVRTVERLLGRNLDAWTRFQDTSA